MITEVLRLEKKVDDLAYVVGLIYKKKRSTSIGIFIEDIQVFTHPRGERSKESESKDSKDKGGDLPPPVDP